VSEILKEDVKYFLVLLYSNELSLPSSRFVIYLREDVTLGELYVYVINGLGMVPSSPSLVNGL
jgi:hypothetical protein